MATGNIDQLSLSSSTVEPTNDALTALKPAGLFGYRASTSAGLVMGLYGGISNFGGVAANNADSTIALTASLLNYVECTIANPPVISKNTSAFTAGRQPLYTVNVGATGFAYTDLTDYRGGLPAFAAASFAVPITVAQGGSGRITGTTAYALIATGTTATGAEQSLTQAATTEILVGGGAALPVWTTATGTGAPVRTGSPTITTPVLTGLPTGTGVASANTVSTLVARDGSGNFAAGTITAALTGTASGNLVSGGALGTPSSGTGTNITGVNAATLGGATFAAPGVIGGGTPAAASFTTISGTTGTFTDAVTISKAFGGSPGMTINGLADSNASLSLVSTTSNAYSANTSYASKTTGGATVTWVTGTGLTGGTGAWEIYDGSQRFRIDSGGGVVITGTLGVSGLATITDAGNTNNYKFVSFVTNGAEAGNVIRVGTTSAVVYTTTSDERAKNVFGDSDIVAAHSRTMRYRMRDYELKSQPGLHFDGPIAQEIHEVNKTPMLVTPGDGKTTWGVNMSGFIPDLIMTVQKMQAQIDALTAQVKALQ